MFPWESAYTGSEVDPAPGTTTEEHLQGDIAFAFHQYWTATHDLQWLVSTGFAVLDGIADFWVSKAVANTDGSYSIPHIMGPDEYHGDVRDSVFCNVVARLSIAFAEQLAPLVGRAPNATRAAIGAALRIEFDATLNYHPEFAGYTRGTKVKQADTILLGFPLNFAMDEVVKANDLVYYAGVTDPRGPAMTWSMHAIGFLDLGKDDEAASFFHRGHADNTIGPFLFWREEAGGGGATNFITGAGGFMQSCWAGYGGMRQVNGTLQLTRPRPLPGTTSLAIKQFNFLGSALDLSIGPDEWTVCKSAAAATGDHGPAPQLELFDVATGMVQPLTTDPVHFRSGVDVVTVRPVSSLSEIA